MTAHDGDLYRLRKKAASVKSASAETCKEFLYASLERFTDTDAPCVSILALGEVNTKIYMILLV